MVTKIHAQTKNFSTGSWFRVCGVWGGGVCGVCGRSHRPLLTFDIPQTAFVATLDTYDFYHNIYYPWHSLLT
jgi:hypothetical protein